MVDLTQIIDQITRHFGGEHLPAVFKRLTANEEHLAAIWKQYEAVMSEGEIDIVTKELLGMCVGVAKPNEYIIGLQQRRIRRAGVDEEAEMEVLSVAGFFEGFNSYAHVVNIDDGPAAPADTRQVARRSVAAKRVLMVCAWLSRTTLW